MKVSHPNWEPAANLDELLARVENDRELLRELVVIFKDDFPSQMSALRRAIAQADLKTAERSSHTLKGMFLSLAAARAAASANRLEQLARARDTAALPSALALLDKEVALLIPELESHLAKIEA
jgi:two-component system, sensor histidine kinase and response regulator